MMELIYPVLPVSIGGFSRQFTAKTKIRKNWVRARLPPNKKDDLIAGIIRFQGSVGIHVWDRP